MTTYAARTNYARFTDIDALQTACEQHGVQIQTGPENFAMLMAGEQVDGEFPVGIDDDGGEFIEDIVVPLLEPRSVLVVEGVGFDKMRSMTGYAIAWMRDDAGETHWHRVSLSDVYAQAASKFGVPRADIAHAVHDDLPASYVQRGRESMRG